MQPDFIEIGTDEHATAKEFFATLFEWDWVSMGDGKAGYFEDGKRQVGLHDGDVPCIVPHIAVRDIEAMTGKVRQLGGSVIGEIADAPGLGQIATCTDPRGARFGLHQR